MIAQTGLEHLPFKVTGVATLPTEVHSYPPAWPIRDDIRYLLSHWVGFIICNDIIEAWNLMSVAFCEDVF